MTPAQPVNDTRPHAAAWPKWLPLAINPPATSLWFNLEVSAARYPDKPAIVFLGQVLTYRDLHEKALRLAGWLAAQGVGRGDRVLLYMQNSPQWVVACYAIMRANAVVVPVNPMNRADELGHYITDPDARWAIVAADLAGELAYANHVLPPEQRLKTLLVAHYHDMMDNSWLQPNDGLSQTWQNWLGARHTPPVLAGGQVFDWADALRDSGSAPVHAVGPTDLAVLPYTSGTTGLPKGCMHTHASLMHNAVATTLWNQATPESVSLVVVPLFHITGMVVGMHGSIYSGSTMVMLPRWDRELAGQQISRWRVTHWANIPTMIIDLLASPNFASFDLSSLVYIGGGGAAMPQAVAQRLLDSYGLRYAEGYGLTETAAPTHNNPLDRPKQQCLGIPFVGTHAQVVDPDTLDVLPQGEAGEIVVSGPQVFDGYWKRPDATAAVFFEQNGQRFFRTGDLGRVDEEGYFYITDRLKRMINASGYKVWPAEVEALMFKHPAIAEACVIGTQDAYRGESVKAVVVLRTEARGTVSEADLVAWCREHMAVYKVPRVIQFAEVLPKSGSGKVLWRQLQESEPRS